MRSSIIAIYEKNHMIDYSNWTRNDRNNKYLRWIFDHRPVISEL